MRTGKVHLTAFTWLAVRSHFAYGQNGLEGEQEMLTEKVHLTDLIWSSVRSHFAYMQNGLDGGSDADRKSVSYRVETAIRVQGLLNGLRIPLFALILCNSLRMQLPSKVDKRRVE